MAHCFNIFAVKCETDCAMIKFALIIKFNILHNYYKIKIHYRPTTIDISYQKCSSV